MKEMIKRKDGSYSQRGLWDNIRANRGSGKKPTAEMLRQEKKIKSKMKDGGKVKVKAGGENHVIYKKETKQGKGKVGHIMVNHPTMDKGKWDTIDLTAMNKKINTVKEGVAATKKWHKEHPYPKKKMQMGGLTPAQQAAKKLAMNMKGKVVGSDRMLKHGGTHSRLKQAYLNRY
jgi:hypothetical protein